MEVANATHPCEIPSPANDPCVQLAQSLHPVQGALPSTHSELLTKAKSARKLLSVDRLKVYISVNVVSLFSVDTVAETFTVRLSITMIWPAVAETLQEELHGLADGLDDADVDWEPKWYPRYGIRNKVASQEQVENFYSILVGSDNHPASVDRRIQSGHISLGDFWIVRESVSNVVINMSEKLRNFPFDLQDLQIMIRMEHATTQVELVRIEELPREVRQWVPSHICLPMQSVAINFSNLDTAERCVWRKAPCKMKLSNDFLNRVRRHQCGAVQVGIIVERRLGHYLYNVFLMVCCITSLVFACWAIKIEDTGDRLACDIALILTMQAFKLVIADKLPKVNYLTFVDIYIINCFLFVMAGIAMHCWTGYQGTVWDRELDNIFRFVWLGTWIAYNLMYLILWKVSRNRREKRLTQAAIDEGFSFLRQCDVNVDRAAASGEIVKSTTRSVEAVFPLEAGKTKDN